MINLCCIMMMQGLNLIVSQLKDIETLINESLEKQFSRTKETNRYEKIKEHLMRIEDQFLDWNSKIMGMMNMKEGTKLETLLEASKNASEDFIRINEKLRKLRDKAETNIAFKNYEYQEMKEIQMPKLYQAYQFSEDNNVVHFIEEIRRITTNTNFSTNVLEKLSRTMLTNKYIKTLRYKYL